MNPSANRIVNFCRCGDCGVCKLFAGRDLRSRTNTERLRARRAAENPQALPRQWLKGYDGPVVPTRSLTAMFCEWAGKYLGLVTREFPLVSGGGWHL